MLTGLLAAALLLAGVSASPSTSQIITVWPGYTLQVPAGYCVDVDNGPDFDVFFVRESAGDRHQLVGVYAGYAPSFQPDDSNPDTRHWNKSAVAFTSGRGEFAPIEYLVHDPSNSARGYLHIWFGPAVAAHPELEQRFIASIRPSPLPVVPSDPPRCSNGGESPNPSLQRTPPGRSPGRCR